MLAAVDELDEITLGTRPTMSHVTARVEMETLLRTMRLGDLVGSGAAVEHSRDAA